MSRRRWLCLACGLLWLKAALYGGTAVFYAVMSFWHGDAGLDAISNFFLAMVLLYAVEEGMRAVDGDRRRG